MANFVKVGNSRWKGYANEKSAVNLLIDEIPPKNDSILYLAAVNSGDVQSLD